MHHQVVLAEERHGAVAAPEGPLARVRALVPLQVAGAGEALRAEAAPEGPVATVRPLVPRQVEEAGEALGAEAARVRQGMHPRRAAVTTAPTGCLQVGWAGENGVRRSALCPFGSDVELLAEVWCKQ